MTSLPVSLTRLLKIPPADNKTINRIFVLSLRRIRTWVKPDLMSPVLFSFFIVD